MTGQSGDGERAEDPAHAEDRINWARRRAHARQRAADSRQRRIAYSLDPPPATRPAPGLSAAPYAGNGDLSATGDLAPPIAGTPPGVAADSPLLALDAEC